MPEDKKKPQPNRLGEAPIDCGSKKQNNNIGACHCFENTYT